MIDSRIYNSLQANIPSSALIIKKFVRGDDRSNYELYLTELINASDFFRKKLHDGCYIYQEIQSDSEPDCVGNG